MLMTACVASALGWDLESGGVYYNFTEDDQVAVAPAWHNGVSLYEGTVILPEQVYCDGRNYRVTAIADSAFWRSAVTEVQIPNSITWIGRGAMAETPQLTSVTLPLNLTAVTRGMLAGSAVANVAVPEGVAVVDDGAFAGCMQLHTVILPSTIRWIGNRAFSECYNLFEIYCAAPMPPMTGQDEPFGTYGVVDMIVPDHRTAARYDDDALWGDGDVFSLWVDEGLVHTPDITAEDLGGSWVSLKLGDNMGYKIYGSDGYLRAVTCADRYYLPVLDHDEEYLIVPTNAISDDEDGELAYTVSPAAPAPPAEDELTIELPHPYIHQQDGYIYIDGDNYGGWTRIYDVYGNLWYERPSVCGNIYGLPRGRIYLVCVNDYVKKIVL